MLFIASSTASGLFSSDWWFSTARQAEILYDSSIKTEFPPHFSIFFPTQNGDVSFSHGVRFDLWPDLGPFRVFFHHGTHEDEWNRLRNACKVASSLIDTWQWTDWRYGYHMLSSTEKVKDIDMIDIVYIIWSIICANWYEIWLDNYCSSTW